MIVKPWTFLEEKNISKNRSFSVFERKYKSPLTNKDNSFYVLKTNDWVHCLAITEKKEIIFVKQFRFGSQEISLEFPGGVIDKDEDPAKAALRETQEETGYINGNIIPLGIIKPNPAILNNNCHAFLVENLKATGILNLDETEEVETVLVSFAKIPKLIREGTLNHAISLSVWALYQNYLNSN